MIDVPGTPDPTGRTVDGRPRETHPPASPGTEGLVVAPLQPRRGQMVVRVRGEVDMATAPRLGAVLEQAVAAVAAEARVDASSWQDAATPMVVCDLDAVSLVSAAGLTVMLQVTAVAAARGVTWVVVASTGPARRAFELTGLDRAVPLRTESPLPAPAAHPTAGPGACRRPDGAADGAPSRGIGRPFTSAPGGGARWPA